MSTTTARTEEVLVLYASQLGTSEKAAKSFAEEMTTELSPQAIQSLTDNNDESLEITVVPTVMTLDEFLEVKGGAAWTRLVIIFVSSYGMGASPQGGHRFRDLCEEWKDQHENNNTDDDNGPEKILKGLNFAMCGLGNSSFRTFFENPTVIHDGLQAAGATRVGPLGKADANKRGDDESQAAVIAKWKQEIWKPLAEVLVQESLSEEVLKEMQDKTNAIKF